MRKWTIIIIMAIAALAGVDGWLYWRMSDNEVESVELVAEADDEDLETVLEDESVEIVSDEVTQIVSVLPAKEQTVASVSSGIVAGETDQKTEETSSAPTETPPAEETPSPPPSPPPAPIYSCDVGSANEILNAINAYRAERGKPPFAANRAYADFACSHSLDMVQNNFFSHTSPTKGDFQTRVIAAGSGARFENLADHYSTTGVVDSWDASPGHQVNLVSDYPNVGIGVVWSGGRFKATLVFGN